MPTVFDQQISELSLEIHPWIFLEHLLNHLWRHVIEAQAKQFEPGAEMNQCYLVCQPSCDSWRGVQRDRLPNEIGALGRDLMFRAELAGSIRAIHLKPIVAAVRRNQPEVVQNRAAKSGFLVDYRTAEAPDSKATENVCSKTMSAEKPG